MKDAYYFSHDCNARHDPKILAMRSVYGPQGYGWYWIIIELLREQTDYKIKIDKYVWNSLAMQTQSDADAIHQFILDCINEFNLLQSDDYYIWSESLLRRMDQKDIKSQKARQSANIRWGKNNDESDNLDNANALQTHSECNAIKESKVKENKVNKKNSSSSEREAKLFKAFEENFVIEVNSIQREKLSSYLDDGMEPELIEKAISITRENGKNINFFWGVLNRFIEQGTKTIKSYELREKERKKQNDIKTNPRGQPIRREKIPDYILQQDEKYHKNKSDEKVDPEKLKEINRLLESLGEKTKT